MQTPYKYIIKIVVDVKYKIVNIVEKLTLPIRTLLTNDNKSLQQNNRIVKNTLETLNSSSLLKKTEYSNK